MNRLRISLLAATAIGCCALVAAAPTQLGNLLKPSAKPLVDATATASLPPATTPAAFAGSLPNLRPNLEPASQADMRATVNIPGQPNDALAAISGSLNAPSSGRLPEASGLKEAPSAQNLLAYAAPRTPLPDGNPLLAEPPAILVDITGVREAIAAYRNGDMAAGDQAAASTTNPTARAAIDWAAFRLQPRLERMRAFISARPDWPTSAALRKRAEEALYADRKSSRQVNEFFAPGKPETPLGKLALARALQADGRVNEANELVRDVWRNNDLSIALETNIRKEFGDALGKADHKFRSDRFAYKENTAASQRIAALAGPDILALAVARASLNDKQIAALPAELKNDPTLQFFRIKKLRKDNKIAEAANLMLTAPRDPAVLVNADEWWVERRLLARKALDSGDAKTAWRIAAEHSAVARDQRIEAEFHAGWFALRFLNDPALAKPHFDNCAKLAETPMSIARAAYWQGRASEASGDKETAKTRFETAANHSTSYYGQLARARLGRNDFSVRGPLKIARGDERIEVVRVVELLIALDQKDLARPLAIEAARNLNDEAQIAALAEVLVRAKDAGATLSIGKIASQRGFNLDEHAYPTFGIPDFTPLARSAEKPMVYAIARQESAFATTAYSSVGAKGLMQMMTPTARMTAQRAGVSFDEGRLINDPVFNAQLGAAHLADLLGEYRNSNILTFVAYNAGGKRVREWIAAYGDPRNPEVDPIDWIERIPFSETRNYVQRIVENLEVYRVRLGERQHLAIEQTLRQAEEKR